MNDGGMNSVGGRFSAAAATYDDAADVQFAVAERVDGLLADDLVPERVLDVGSGTGLLTEMVSERFPDAHIDSIDIAADLVEMARLRFEDNELVDCTVGDVMGMTGVTRYPLIVSSSSLHWIQPLPELFEKLADMLLPGGSLAFGMMVAGTLAELRESRIRVAPDKAFGSLPTAEDVALAWEGADLQCIEHEVETRHADYSSASEFLQVIHRVGVTGGAVSSAGTPLTRSELRELVKDYEHHYSVETGGVYASYRVLYACLNRADAEGGGGAGFSY